jgi:hypothetical protein
MAVPIPGTLPRILESGLTGAQTASRFFTVQTSGARELAEQLLNAATRAGIDGSGPLTAAARKAADPILKAYRQNINSVTGNLSRSVKIRSGKKRYEGIGIAVVGPVHVIDAEGWDLEKKGAGNHAWLTEFGTGPRRPATQGRRTYLNVHQKINGRFTQVPNKGRPFDNEQFERMGRGFYFLMGSKNVPQRRTGKGAFVPNGRGGTRPYFLGPNETYPAMPARGWMQAAIQQAGPAALNTLMAALRSQVDRISKGAA